MSLKLNLLIGQTAHEDTFEYIVEETNRNTPSNLYIKGPYMMAEGINKNKRILKYAPNTTQSFIFTAEKPLC